MKRFTPPPYTSYKNLITNCTSLRFANGDVAVSDIKYARDCFTNVRNDMKKAFTLAEVLITLVVIGIIAAITVPMIHANYQKQETISKLKKAYSTLSQLINRSQFDNGKVAEWFIDGKSTEELFNIYFKPYLRSAKLIKYGTDVYDSQFPFKNLSGEGDTFKVYSSNTRTGFFLDDGVFVIIYGFEADSEGNDVNRKEPIVIVDINGGKKPNQFGRDVFQLTISEEKGLQPSGYDVDYHVTLGSCKKTGWGSCCLNKIMHDGWEIKDDYPW